MKKYYILPILCVMLCLCGCASSERMMRLSPVNASSYSIPDAARLRGDAYKKQPSGAETQKAINEDRVINIWPIFLKNDEFYSILWPFIDYDKYGVAVRPFYNKEGDDHSILFPLSGWNSADGSGWVLNTVWDDEGLSIFPIFSTRDNYLYIFPVSYSTFSDEQKTLRNLYIFPFLNYEKDSVDDEDYLFYCLPFCGWVKNHGGFVLNTYWGQDYCGSFPFFHYSEDTWMALLAYKNSERYGFFPLFAQNLDADGGYFFPLYMYYTSDNIKFVNAMLLFNYLNKTNGRILSESSSSEYLVFPFFSATEKNFKFTEGSVNSFYWDMLDKQCSLLKQSMEDADMPSVIKNKKAINETLTALKLQDDITIPSDMRGFEYFVAELQKRCGVVETEDSFALLPFYSYESNGTNRIDSLLLGMLYRRSIFYDHEQKMPWQSQTQTVEANTSRTLLLASHEQEMKRKFSSDISPNERYVWYELYEKLKLLAVSMERDEFYAGDSLFKSETPDLKKEVARLAAALGITLPELEKSAQCYIFRKELEGMSLEYFKSEKISLFPLFEYENSDVSGRFEIFPLFFTDHERYSKYHTVDRFNLLLLCHNQAERSRVPAGKFKKVISELDNLEDMLSLNRGTHDLAKALKEANLAFSVPKNFRECRTLREKLYGLMPENTERISAFFPLYFYKGNDVLDDSYLNILGIFYNHSRSGDDYWFNVLGFLSRGSKTAEQENFCILEFFYRSSRNKDEKDYFIFPFFYYRETENTSQFSFLHRIFNIEKSSNGSKGHIFYIPFGE